MTTEERLTVLQGKLKKLRSRPYSFTGSMSLQDEIVRIQGQIDQCQDIIARQRSAQLWLPLNDLR